MAFRIHDSVARGEVDNRVKGKVRGRIWVEGRAEPVVLELLGNAWSDLAGCRLTFTNPQQHIAHPHLDSLDPIQRGTVGDLTASRKVRVFDVPLEEALREVAVPARVKAALMGMPGELRTVLDVVTAFERGDWEIVTSVCRDRSLDSELMVSLFLGSMDWARAASSAATTNSMRP